MLNKYTTLEAAQGFSGTNRINNKVKALYRMLFGCIWYVIVVLVAKLCLILLWPQGLLFRLTLLWLPSDSSVHGIFQGRILEWVAISFTMGSSRPGEWTLVSFTGRQILYRWATRKAHVADPLLKKGVRYLLKFPSYISFHQIWKWINYEVHSRIVTTYDSTPG